MNPIVRRVGGTLGSLLIAACVHAPSSQPVTRSGDLISREAEFFAANTARDASAMLEFFSEDAVLHVANMPPVAGRPQIARFYQNVYANLVRSSASNERARLAESTDLGYTAGSVVNTFATGEGTSEFAGKYLIVWRKSGDRWVISAYAISSNASNPSR